MILMNLNERLFIKLKAGLLCPVFNLSCIPYTSQLPLLKHFLL
jgi:hypothetical protein